MNSRLILLLLIFFVFVSCSKDKIERKVVFPNALIGTWENNLKNDHSYHEINIRMDADSVYLHLWGYCTPVYCDIGEHAVSITETSDGEFVYTVILHFIEIVDSVSHQPGNVLKIVSNRHYTDNSGRTDYRTVNTFQKKQ